MQLESKGKSVKQLEEANGCVKCREVRIEITIMNREME